jgi:hypothetical protein
MAMARKDTELSERFVATADKLAVALEKPLTVKIATNSPPRDVPSHALWQIIAQAGRDLSFKQYSDFLNGVVKIDEDAYAARIDRGPKEPPRVSPLQTLDAYEILRMATTFWMLQQSAEITPSRFIPLPGDGGAGGKGRIASSSFSNEELRELRRAYYKDLQGEAGALVHRSVLPYIDRVFERLDRAPFKEFQDRPFSYGVLPSRLTRHLGIELIWSYWMEEGGIVQTMNAILHRFQNRRAPYARDPLANLTTAPLQALSNVLWGLAQSESDRLSVVRRAYEYMSQYGFRIYGRAVPDLDAVDVRTRFVGAFHDLLQVASRFYRDSDDTTVQADAFPLLRALQDVHFVLSEGMHNQYGGLTWQARLEMLAMQWVLAQEEIRDFLQTRAMVPYPEDWMGPVDAMRRLQGWGGASIVHYAELATVGERILLSIRFDDWNDPSRTSDVAAAWAIAHRDAVSKYIHAYRTVTGVDVTTDAVSVQGVPPNVVEPRHRLPGDLLQLRQQSQYTPLPQGAAALEPAPLNRQLPGR